MLPKPPSCTGCVLAERGQGFVPPSGLATSPILLLGEASGEEEARQGVGFVGAAGGMLNRLLARIHQDRASFRVGNVIGCRPPNNWLEGAPYAPSAIAHCAVHRDPLLNEPRKVVVALGGTALRTLLRWQGKGLKLNDWHGTLTRDPDDRFWIVPTFHPSHLQRGATNLFGAVAFDLQVALRTVAQGRPADPAQVVVDPPLDWFTWWTDQVCQAVARDCLGVWLSTDIETPDKAAGQDEGELGAEDRSYQILRVNFGVHPDEGITVPYAGPYIPLIERLLALSCPKALWNKEYDQPRLEAAGHTCGGDWYDFMWAWHHLQSDLPRGLGFVAPFYSGFGAWKHLSESDPGYYAGCDGFQNLRVAFGVATDLHQAGAWDIFARHTHAVHKLALRPAQLIGVKIDRQALTVFIEDLEVKQRRLLHQMQGMVPDALRPLTPKGGLKRAPEAGQVHTKGREVKKDGTPKKEAPDPIKQELYAQVATVVSRAVHTTALCCDRCGAQEVGKTHRCKDAKGDNPAVLTLHELDVTRWFWQEPFNPDSPDQILNYILAKGHKPGKAKKTGADSTDRETLNRLSRDTKDTLYKTILDSRSVIKVKGTYGVGTLKRMDAEDRVHPEPTFKPSTHRLSYRNPNITNVIADKDNTETLAAGFRGCIVATGEDPAWVVEGWAGRYER